MSTKSTGREHIEEPLTYFVGNGNGRGLIRIEEENTGEHIASAPRGAQSEAHIAELVRRYNQHPSLLAALKGLEECPLIAGIAAGIRDWARQAKVPDPLATARKLIASAAEPKAEGKGTPNIHPDQFDANTL